MTFTLSVDSAPNTVKAFTLDIQYDFTVLSYKEMARGMLTDGTYSLFSANNISPGVIRIGGVEPVSPGIQKGSSGTFAFLTFEVIGEADTGLKFLNLENDIATWTTQDGYFSFVGIAVGDSKEDAPSQEQLPSEQGETVASTKALETPIFFTGGDDYLPPIDSEPLQGESLRPKAINAVLPNASGSSRAGGGADVLFNISHGMGTPAARRPAGRKIDASSIQKNAGHSGKLSGQKISGPIPVRPHPEGSGKTHTIGPNRFHMPGNGNVANAHIDNHGHQIMLTLLAVSLVVQVAILAMLMLIFMKLNARAKNGQPVETGAILPACENALPDSSADGGAKL